MTRKKVIKKSLPKADFKYNSILVSLLINRVLKCGKKNLARKIVYLAFNYINIKVKKNPILIFEKAIHNVCPRVKLEKKNIEETAVQVPVVLNLFNSVMVAIRWIIQVALKRSEKQMYLKLANEILDASKGIGNTVKKKEEIHKKAKATKSLLELKENTDNTI